MLRIAALETANNILQEEMDTLKSAAAQQELINTDLQASDNSTNDHLQVVETDLQQVEEDLQGGFKHCLGNFSKLNHYCFLKYLN